MKNVLSIVLEALYHVLGLMLKLIFCKCLKKCLMLQALSKVLVLVLQALKSVLEPIPDRESLPCLPNNFTRMHALASFVAILLVFQLKSQ